MCFVQKLNLKLDNDRTGEVDLKRLILRRSLTESVCGSSLVTHGRHVAAPFTGNSHLCIPLKPGEDPGGISYPPGNIPGTSSMVVPGGSPHLSHAISLSDTGRLLPLRHRF